MKGCFSERKRKFNSQSAKQCDDDIHQWSNDWGLPLSVAKTNAPNLKSRLSFKAHESYV